MYWQEKMQAFKRNSINAYLENKGVYTSEQHLYVHKIFYMLDWKWHSGPIIIQSLE